ncbi:hypothetical protein ACTWQB_16830 [Piscibacillus sp. B03]|uniref:hypothetical protein n=1 Tax=Piscibacillus sp. B03 TaxID=3457430 RepID=UPI003FCCFD9F
MRSQQRSTPLKDLTIATLIGPGMITNTSNEYKVIAPYQNVNKGRLLKRYINQQNLDDYVLLKPKSQELVIYLPEEEGDFLKNWLDDNKQKFPPSVQINEYTILLSFLFFGEKKYNHLKLTSEYNTQNLRLLAYYIYKKINILIETTKDGLKLYDCKALFLTASKYFSIEDMNEFSFYLSNKEKKKIRNLFQTYRKEYMT